MSEEFTDLINDLAKKKDLNSAIVKCWEQSHQCNNPDIRYAFHEKTKGVYKVCFGCFVNLGAVPKVRFLNQVTSSWSDFNEKRRCHINDSLAESSRRWDEKQREFLQRRVESEEFYNSKEWLRVRYQALQKHYELYGHTCLCCKARYVPLHVDHIKPRSKYPELALEISNLQVLCADCNIGKSNVDETDFRPNPNLPEPA